MILSDFSIIDISLAVVIILLIVGAILLNLQLKLECPGCEHPIPKIREPQNWKELENGSYTCKKCGCYMEFDFLGKIKNFQIKT